LYSEHEKQAAHGWGGQDGGSEWADEKAGEAIAKADEKEDGPAVDATGEAAEVPEPEPEDKSISYAAYLAEQAEKKLSLAAKDVRKANEGSSAKFPEGKPITRDDEDEAYIAGSGGKAKRERERKQKEFVELDDAKLHRETRDTTRGGRGGRGRGDRSEFRGGEGRGRGDFRGGEGRGRGGRGRGEGRGRGGRGQAAGPNLADTNAFPSLGS
jgi:plasminogen activator inhibitor 1 RNA-binding protein